MSRTAVAAFFRACALERLPSFRGGYGAAREIKRPKAKSQKRLEQNPAWGRCKGSFASLG